MHKLMTLHSGGVPTSYDELSALRTPEATKTHCPVPHFDFVRSVKKALGGLMQIEEEQHAVSHQGNRYFGVLALKGQEASFGLMLGLRNSHDKTFPAGFALGTRVFVCDNLAFSSEIVLRRKHTSRIREALPGLVARGIGLLAERVRSVGDQVAAYEAMQIDDSRAYEFIVRGYQAQAIPAMAIPKVLDQWQNPEHEEFQPRNAWSLFNAFTSTYKDANPEVSWPRSQRLHGLFDVPQRGSLRSAGTPRTIRPPGQRSRPTCPWRSRLCSLCQDGRELGRLVPLQCRPLGELVAVAGPQFKANAFVLQMHPERANGLGWPI